MLLLACANLARAAPPLALAPERFTADATLAIDLDKNYAGKALSLSPDLWVGLPAGITVGAITSAAALDRIDASGDSVCIAKATDVCERALHGGGLDVRAAALPWLAPRARLLVRDVDPWKSAATLGALVVTRRGRWTLWGDPYVQLGLANTARGNRARLEVPVFAEYARARWALALHTGYDSELAGWRDDFHVPVALGARVAVTPDVTLGAEAGLRSALGPQNASNYRALLVTASFTSPRP